MITDTTPLAALAYVSTATHALGEYELERLLESARDFNAGQQVTGVLLFDDGNFFQYIEGPRAGLAPVYERIRRSRQHFGIIQVLDRDVPARQFQDWKMGFTRAPRSLPLQLSQAAWSDAVADLRGRAANPAGMGMLMDFWVRAIHR